MMMKSLRTALVVLWCLGGAGALASETPLLALDDKPEGAEKSQAAPDKRVCKRIKITGSHLRQRVCQTERQWTQMEREARENAERAMEGKSRSVSSES